MTGSDIATFEVRLADSNPEYLETLSIRIVATDVTVSIYAEGLGCPLSIELHRGCLKVIASSDLCTNAANISSLSSTREDGGINAQETPEMTPLQLGRKYHEFMAQTNPTTGRPFTMKEAAAALNFEYATFRKFESLWRSPS